MKERALPTCTKPVGEGAKRTRSMEMPVYQASRAHFGLQVRPRFRTSLRRPGLSDLSPRVFRPPMVWTASSVSDVPLGGGFISVDRFDAWPSEIRWDGDRRYPLTTGCDRFEPNVSPPAPPLSRRSP